MSYEADSIEGRFLAGDAQAYGEVARWVVQVLHSGRFRTLREQLDDLTQESMERVVASLRAGRYDSSRSFRAYVQSIARYAAREVWLRRLRRPETATLVPLEELVSVNPEPGGRVLTEQILASATPDCRLLFRLYFSRLLGVEEIAKQLEIPAGTVRSRLFRCVQKARDFVRRRKSPQAQGNRRGRPREASGGSDADGEIR